MKHAIVVAAITIALAPAVHAQLYKYVDKDGKTVYSDQPPVNADSKQLKPAATAAPVKSAVERDKEMEKTRKEAREKQEKADKAAKGAEDQQRACSQAQAAYRAVSEGGRVYKIDEKGERVFMEDAELEAEKRKAKSVMDEACRKG